MNKNSLSTMGKAGGAAEELGQVRHLDPTARGEVRSTCSESPAILSFTILASGQERELVTERDTPKRISMRHNLRKNNKLPRLLGSWTEGLACGLNVIS